MKKIIKKRNFVIVVERKSRSGNGSIILRTSGYTTTEQAIREPWIWTQIKTVPHSDRSHLPDPFILPQNIMTELYNKLDCTVYNLYFLPECKGLKYAVKEAAEFLETEVFPYYKKHALIGHSKGGLFVAALTKELVTKTNIVLVAPTFGTIMGNEEAFCARLQEYQNQQFTIKKILISLDIAVYKKIMHIVGSRRPIDYDMSINSRFIGESLDLSKIENHRTILISACCPKGICNPIDAIFRHYGKYLGLDKRADGMVKVINQRLPVKYGVNKLVHLRATHPTVLNKAVPEIIDFLSE